MNVVLFGASGMVGRGVLRECLLDPEVGKVLVIGRTPCGVKNAKLQELIHKDLADYSTIASKLAGYDACFFCLGISSAGMNEADYRRITYDYTLAAAKALLEKNPSFVFVFVSGASTDGTGAGKVMWARVKGQTENALLQLPFKGAYMFRPGYIQPMHGEPSKTKLYRVLYAVLTPMYPVLKRLFPKMTTTTEHIGRAMLFLAKQGNEKRVLESVDIEAIGSKVPASLPV